MIFVETKLRGAYIIDINPIEDSRGFFARSWCRKEFTEHNLNSNLAQCNTSFNFKKGTLRGMHFQVHPYAETKLVRCTRGAIYDVVVDLRKNSETYLQWVGVELTSDNRRMLYVPEGFAHGYQTLQDSTEVFYQVTEYYTPGAEGGLRWNDPTLAIEWPVIEDIIISNKDKNWPLIKLN